MGQSNNSTTEPSLYDWGLLALIIALGGSSFAMIQGAVETIPPSVIGPVRLWVGALTLYILMRAAGRNLPPLFIDAGGKRTIRKSWQWMIAVGVVGNVLPFFIFPWAQQYVESGLAGIYMAFMPIWTILLAYFFVAETLTRQKLIGFGLGFLGVVILMGPDAIRGVLTADFRAQAALLFATLLYAVSAVIARKAPPIRPRIFSTGMILAAAVASTPALLIYPLQTELWTASSILSVIGLGIFPTGLAGVLIIILIRRTSAGFMSLANYITPLWAVALGAILFGERLNAETFLALGVILVGVALSQRRQKATPEIASPEFAPALASNDDTALLDKDGRAADSH